MTRRLTLVVLFLLAAAASLPSRAQLPDFSGLVERVGPAVVNIEATRTAEAAARDGLPGDNDMPEALRRYFGLPGMPRGAPRDQTSRGTGFIISADGYVLTNHHVIDGADEVVVRLTDRRELAATVVGSDAQADVALLKLDAKGLPVLPVGEAKALKPGQWVLAIGSPFGFDHSVTAGIVSAVGRTNQYSGQQYVPFIQTDVAINRGNSGGPLLDIDGRVVGINSQIFSNTGGFMGVSFAIPIDVAMNSVEQIKKTGKVSRGLLGVTVQEVGREVAEALGLPRPGGALVNGFSDDSAAERAGVKLGDVIIEFDGTEVARSSDLPPLVGATRPGTRTTLKVFRDGKTLSLDVTVGELPQDAVASNAQGGGSAAAATLWLDLEPLTAEQRRELGLGADEGLLVRRVGGAAPRRAGLRPGDVVLQVGRQPVGSVAAFREAEAKAGADRAVMLLVRRGEQTQFVAVSPQAPRE